MKKIAVIISIVEKDRIAEDAVLKLLDNELVSFLEIIVIDARHTKNDNSCIARYPVKYFRLSKSSRAAAWNYGVLKSNSEYIMFVDENILVKKDLIIFIIKTLENIDVELIKFKTERYKPLPFNCYAEYQDNLDIIIRKYMNSANSFIFYKMLFLDTDCFVVSSRLFHKVGMFSERFTYAETLDFFLRVKKYNALIAYYRSFNLKKILVKKSFAEGIWNILCKSWYTQWAYASNKTPDVVNRELLCICFRHVGFKISIAYHILDYLFSFVFRLIFAFFYLWKKNVFYLGRIIMFDESDIYFKEKDNCFLRLSLGDAFKSNSYFDNVAVRISALKRISEFRMKS